MNGQGKRVTIYIGETDQWHHQPAYMAILEFLRREGCAGATVERGLAGFGANSRIKTASLLELSMDLPVVVTWVDRPDRIETLLPQLAQMVPAGLITVEDIHVYQYSSTLREGLPDVKVEQIMTREVTTVGPEGTLAEVVEKLLDKPYTALPVVNAAGRLVGIISDTDLLERGDMEVSISLKRATDPELARSLIARLRQNSRTVGQVMTLDPVTIGPKATLSEAARLMGKRRLKRLPVVDAEKRVVGVLSRIDILTALAAAHLPQSASPRQTGRSYAGDLQTVADVMDRSVSTALPEALLNEVLTLVTSSKSQRVVVIDSNHRVVGIISDTDLVARMSPETHPGILEQLVSKLPLGHRTAEARKHLQQARGKTAADIMTHPVITLRTSDSIGTALAMSAERHIKRFPVVDEEGKLVGIVGRGELLGALVGDVPEEKQAEEKGAN
jgi:CBS domain-containing protein